MRLQWVWGAAIATLLLVGSYLFYIFDYGELAHKGEYAALQDLEESNRKISGPPVILAATASGINALGIANADAKHPYVWLVLNDRLSDNDVISVPDVSTIVAKCSDINSRIENLKVDSAVRNFIDAKCVRQ